jgi:hypothetical protein
MKHGINIGLIPGGFQEATIYQRGKHRLFLREKKGFVKVSRMACRWIVGMSLFSFSFNSMP